VNIENEYKGFSGILSATNELKDIAYDLMANPIKTDINLVDTGKEILEKLSIIYDCLFRVGNRVNGVTMTAMSKSILENGIRKDYSETLVEEIK